MNTPFSINIAYPANAAANPWFTVEEITKDTYVISEYEHWEESHCYLLLGKERAALIDTGLGISNIQKVVTELTSLPVQVLTTHAHWDHIGGHGLFQNIAVHEAEENWLSGYFPLSLSVVKQNLASRPCVFPREFNLDAYQIFQGSASSVLRDNDRISLGDRVLTVIHTPGHSPGHCCFYEEDSKYLFSGDLVYSGCLDAFYPSTNPRQFYQSIQRISSLDICRIFPGHHTLNLSPDIILQIEDAFQSLNNSGMLVHGSGIFEFDQFQIQL